MHSALLLKPDNRQSHVGCCSRQLGSSGTRMQCRDTAFPELEHRRTLCRTLHYRLPRRPTSLRGRKGPR